MIDRIVNGLDLAERDQTKNREGQLSQAEWIRRLATKRHRENSLDTPFVGKVAGKDEAVEAFVGSGKWSAACPICGPAATEYVNPEEKIFYCFNCGNRAIDGAARPVKFPAHLEKIEEELIRRPVDDRRGSNLLDRVTQANPMIPGLSRDWRPGQTIGELRAANKRIGEEV